jgi:hypothetical protein
MTEIIMHLHSAELRGLNVPVRVTKNGPTVATRSIQVSRLGDHTARSEPSTHSLHRLPLWYVQPDRQCPAREGEKSLELALPVAHKGEPKVGTCIDDRTTRPQLHCIPHLYVANLVPSFSVTQSQASIVAKAPSVCCTVNATGHTVQSAR